MTDFKYIEPERTPEQQESAREFGDAMQKLMRRIMRHRERYVRAWIAATGIGPEDACIVTSMQPNGDVMVVKRRDEVLTCCKCHEPIVKSDGFFL